MKRALVFLLLTTLAAAGSVSSGDVPLYGMDGSYDLEVSGNGTVLAIDDKLGGRKVRYDFGQCRVDEAIHGGPGDGAFEVLLPGTVDTQVAVVCHMAEGGRRLLIVAPERDDRRPVFEKTANIELTYRLEPAHLVVRSDIGGKGQEDVWRPGDGVDEAEITLVNEFRAEAADRRLDPAPPVDDPEVRALARGLAEIAASRDTASLVAMAAPDVLISFGGISGHEELRKATLEPDFWEEFGRAIAGGVAVIPVWETGPAVVFPAAYYYWPDELDVFGYLYADRKGAKLHAGPSVTTPVIADIEGRILAIGPFPARDEELSAAGWTYLCALAEGCGFAHADDVRSPIDWRAILTRRESEGPWLLQSFVAGD